MNDNPTTAEPDTTETEAAAETAPTAPAARIDAEDEDTSPMQAAADEAASDTVTLTFEGVEYAFARARTNAAQFVAPLLSEGNVGQLKAYYWLLGPAQIKRFLDSTADANGITPTEKMFELFAAVDQAVGVKN